MRKLPKDVLKMASGLISPSGLAGHRRPLCNDPVSRCRDAGEKGSRKETIGYGAGGAVSDIGRV